MLTICGKQFLKIWKFKEIIEGEQLKYLLSIKETADLVKFKDANVVSCSIYVDKVIVLTKCGHLLEVKEESKNGKMQTNKWVYLKLIILNRVKKDYVFVSMFQCMQIFPSHSL